jgi:hypothetical protein
MRHTLLVTLAALALTTAAQAQQSDTPPTHLTIYNDNFAVARTTVPLDLHPGSNAVFTTAITSQLEPDSVILRDPTGTRTLSIAEQNYDAGVVTQLWLLQKYEGKTIRFQIAGPRTVEENGQLHTLPAQTVEGRIVRAGDGNGGALFEVDGQLQFQFPGTPLFPASTDGLLLKPTLRWIIDSPKAERFPAELDYMTNGLSWQATYNIVLPEASPAANERADILGWVTIQNNSGTDFPQATIQLMAGDIAKIRNVRDRFTGGGLTMDGAEFAMAAPPAVTQKAFDDFHLYDLHRTLSLANQETKQVQFLEASGVTVERSYQFDASAPVLQPMYPGFHNATRTFGGVSQPHIEVREEIQNLAANRLGMPLPAGRVRLYRREAGAMQFVGESQVQHTPEGQSLHLVSGRSFDLTGERKQTDFHIDNAGHNMDETFAIKLSNAKPEPVTVHIVEHLNRAENWQITEKSAPFTKTDSSTIDFPVQVPAHGDTTLTYSVHYNWQ